MNPKLPPVLVVDDSPDDTFLLKRLLVKGGVENPLICVEDGYGAQPLLRAAEHDPGLLPCVIFTDLKMPLVNGLELTTWIRHQPRLKALTVIMVTSSTEEKDLLAAQRAEVTEYYEKFPLPATLASIVRRASNPGGEHPTVSDTARKF